VSGIFFKLARCGYTLRVTSQASYSPEYITPTQKNHDYTCNAYKIFATQQGHRINQSFM
jgi:hypothetical protein